MIKKGIVLLLLVTLLMPTAIYGQNVKLIINSQTVKPPVAPIKQNGSTLVPIKIIATELGATVNFDSKKQLVTVVKGNKKIELPIGKKEATVNGKKYKLSVSANIINGTTMVPVRFVADHLDCIVGWDEKANSVIITNKSINNQIEDEKNSNEMENSNEEIEDTKNIYTSEYLQYLVDNTPCSKEVLDFRNSKNPRRNGLLKKEGKYLDIYYPANNNDAEEAIKLLEPHMDKSYMMLTDLYGIQAKVEVHLIDEKDTVGLREGDIRAKENVTYVWLERDNDAGGNNLSEFVHEINHNFFSQTNGRANNTRWIEEAISKLIPSLYIQFNYEGDVVMWKFQDIEIESRNMNDKFSVYGIKFEDINKYFSNTSNDGWVRKEGKERAIQEYALYITSYIYNKNDLDTFKYFLRNQNQQGGTTFEAISRSLNVNLDEFEKEIEEYIYSRKR